MNSIKQVLFFFFFSIPGMAAIAQDIDQYAIRDQYIVQLHSGIDGTKFFAAYTDIAIKECLSKNMNIWLLQSEGQDILTKLNGTASVKVAQYNHGHIIHRNLVPNDSLFNLQWNMLNTATPGADISATEAWQLNHSNLTRLGDSIVIAIIDGAGGDSSSAGPGYSESGFDIGHPDINFFVNHHEIPDNGIDDDSNGYVDDYRGWNVFTHTDDIYSPGGGSDDHPTHVSGIAAARGDNTIGVAGVCWGAKILGVVGASNYESDVVKAYDYVVEMRKLYNQTGGARGAFIVATNSSFGVGNYGADPDSFPIWCALYDTMGHYGILSAVAVPDDSVNVNVVNDVPSGCPSRWMIAVTNTNRTDGLNSQAGYGPTTVDIGAPGTGIISCFPDSSYAYDAGTSMSSPHLAGAVAALFANACPALIQAYYSAPDSIALLVRDYIYQSVDPLSALHNITTTGGRLNLYHAFLTENSFNCNNCPYTATLSQQNLTCYGDSSASISVSGISPAGYHGTVAGLKAGYYQVPLTDATGCQRQLSTVIVPPQRVILTGITLISIGPGITGNIIINASAANDTLYYALDGGSYQTGAIFVSNIPGAHTIHIRNQTGCTIDTTVYLTYTGIDDINGGEHITVYPNPSSGSFYFNGLSHGDVIDIYDLLGQRLSPSISRENGETIIADLSGAARGVYFYKVTNQGKITGQGKLVVE
jgi:hypothetical protein